MILVYLLLPISTRAPSTPSSRGIGILQHAMSGCGVLSYGTCSGSHGLHCHKEASDVELSVCVDRTLRYVLIFPVQPIQANSCAIDPDTYGS